MSLMNEKLKLAYQIDRHFNFCTLSQNPSDPELIKQLPLTKSQLTSNFIIWCARTQHITIIRPVTPMIGVMVGKFSPPHLGHIRAIRQFATQLDQFILCPTFTLGETLPLSLRVAWLKQILSDESKISIYPLIEQVKNPPNNDESDEGASAAWAEFLVGKFPQATHFCGSEPYIAMMARHTNKKFIQLERFVGLKASGITAFANLDLCASLDVVRQLVPRILITGVESAGKSTVSQVLAAKLNCELVQEYGRTYCDLHSGILDPTDLFLKESDIENIALGHNKLVYKAVERAVVQRLPCIVVDTDHVVSASFFKRYFGHNSQLIDEMAMYQRYDVVFFLRRLNFIQDGTRREYGDDQRDIVEEELLQAYQKLKVPVIMVERAPLDERINIIDGVLKTLFQNRQQYLESVLGK